MKRNNSNYCSVRTLRYIECSYKPKDALLEQENQGEVKKRKRLQPKVKQIMAFKELKLDNKIEQALIKQGQNLYEMPKFLQENIGYMLELDNAVIRCNKSDQYFKQMMISLQITKIINSELRMPQIIIISDNPQLIKEGLLMLLDPSIRIFIVKESNSFNYDKIQFLQNTPQIIIGQPNRMNYNISKNQLKTLWVRYFIVDNMHKYSIYNSTEQEQLKAIINFLPDSVNKYFFYDPETTEMTQTIEQLVFN